MRGNPHLWVVLSVFTPENVYEEWSVLVSITSMRRRADTTCVLRPSDPDMHEFVTHDSYVLYEKAREIEVGTLALLSDERRPPVTPSLLARLRSGLHRSPFASPAKRSRVPQQ